MVQIFLGLVVTKFSNYRDLLWLTYVYMHLKVKFWAICPWQKGLLFLLFSWIFLLRRYHLMDLLFKTWHLNVTLHIPFSLNLWNILELMQNKYYAKIQLLIYYQLLLRKLWIKVPDKQTKIQKGILFSLRFFLNTENLYKEQVVLIDLREFNIIKNFSWKLEWVTT